MDKKERLLPEARPALLVVDVQNDYCHPDGALAKAGSDVSAVPPMMQNLHRLIAAARAAAVPVIFIQTIHEDATDSEAWKMRSSGRMSAVCRPGSWGMGFFEVAPLPGEIVVNKHRYSGFINTRLDSVLRAQKIETLVMTGVSTNVCVESTARDGCMLDYHIVMAGDACASFSAQAHEMALENISIYFGAVMDVDLICGIWAAAEKHAMLL